MSTNRKPEPPRLCRFPGRDAWHIYHATGSQRRFSTGCTDRPSAEAVLNAYIESLSAPRRGPVVSISGILGRYLADRADAAIPGWDRLRWAHKPLSRIWGDRPPEAITDITCRAYARTRAKDGVAPGTIRTELEALRAAMNWAIKKKMLAELPEIVMPPRPTPRERWLTQEEADALVAACRAPHLRLAVTIALHTAARIGAILALTWERVDLDQRRINYIDPSKAQTRKRRVRVPINDTLLAALTEAQPGRTCEHVIEWGGGPVASIKHGFHSAADRAGLSDVTPHTLRHTAATWMAQRGVPLWEIAGFMGHTSIQMVQDTYGHHSPDHLARAARSLG